MKNTVYGYCRISTKKQSIDRQIRNIKKDYPDAVIIQEAYTGTKIVGRKEFEKLFKAVKFGDAIVFDSVSRMARDAEEGFKAYEELYNRGVELIFLKEPHINTSTYKKALENNISLTGTSVDYILEGVNKYLMALAKEQIIIAFRQAEKEVADLRQRTKEGITTARLEGKQIGRVTGKSYVSAKEKKYKPEILRLSKDFNGSNTDSEVIAFTGLARGTYYKYKQMLKLEMINNAMKGSE